ncbi:MAG: hypothetical protein HIU91_10100 [Acidobacteria bacterium]|nr:hypothetical protein [Acidobacteriota bacterium]
MPRTNVSPTSGNPVVQQIIDTFLAPAPRRSPETIKENIIHWMKIANSPSQHAAPSASAEAVAYLRLKARQNVRRLAAKHPEVAAEIIATVKPEDVQ